MKVSGALLLSLGKVDGGVVGIAVPIVCCADDFVRKGWDLIYLYGLGDFRELNRNRIRLIEGLTFQGLDSLEVLKLQRNNISKLTDGAFWGLAKMQVL